MSKPVILVVDDDPQVLAAIRRDIRSHYRDNYTVMGASSGQEALKTARELKARGDAVALVVSDQRMPGMLGVDLLAQVREIYPLARRVLLTAYSDIDAAVRAINEAHLNHYLSKPWIRRKNTSIRCSTNCSTSGRSCDRASGRAFG